MDGSDHGHEHLWAGAALGGTGPTMDGNGRERGRREAVLGERPWVRWRPRKGTVVDGVATAMGEGGHWQGRARADSATGMAGG